MSSSNPLQTKHVPKDAQVIMSILKDMGVVDFEPQTIVQLLEFTYSKKNSVHYFILNF